MTRTRSMSETGSSSSRSLRSATQKPIKRGRSKTAAKKSKQWIKAVTTETPTENGSPVPEMTDLGRDTVDSSTRLGDSESDNDSIGDEGLPEIEFSSTTAKTKVKELVPGTVVWAKSRNWPHWPALLVKVFPKEKKAIVNYFDETMQRTRVPFRSMAPFFVSSRSEFIEVGKACKHSKEFLISLDSAEDYLIKQGLGKSTDVTASVSASTDSNARTSTTVPSPAKLPVSPDTPCDTSHDAKAPDPQPPLSNYGLSSDEELRIGHPVSQARQRQGSQEDGDLMERRQMWRDNEVRLLKYIRRGTTKTHLLDIYHGKKPCERQRLYRSMRARDRQKLRHMAGVGPITDEELERELTDFLTNLYMDHCMESKADIPSTAYIAEVWLPEAIIFAIQKTRKVGKRNAEKLFYSEGVQSMLDLGEDFPILPQEGASHSDELTHLQSPT